MSLLNDVLRDLEKREPGPGNLPPDAVPPGLLTSGLRDDRSGAGLGRGQVIRLVVWALVLLSLITAVIVGWRSLNLGQQALDRIPVDENLQAIPRNAAIAPSVIPVEPLPPTISSPQDTAPSSAPQPVPTSQYSVSEVASLSGPAPGEPASKPYAGDGLAEEAPTFSPIEVQAIPAGSAVSEPDKLLAKESVEPAKSAVSETSVTQVSGAATTSTLSPPAQPAQPAQPAPANDASSASPTPVKSGPQREPEAPATTRETPNSSPVVRTGSSGTKSATLVARRLDEARSMQAQGQTQAALDHLDGLDPTQVADNSLSALQSFRAGLLQQQGRWQEAANLYAALLQKQSNDPTLTALESRWWSGLAIAQEQLKAPARAHAAWLNAIAAGHLPAAMESYAGTRIQALAKAGINPDYRSVLEPSPVESNQHIQQDQQ